MSATDPLPGSAGGAVQRTRRAYDDGPPLASWTPAVMTPLAPTRVVSPPAASDRVDPRGDARVASTVRAAASIAVALLLAGCSRAPQPTIALPALEGGNGRMAWRGMLPCADCDGIQTSLQLQRSGERRGYQLVEVYVLGDQGARFVDSGRWTREGDLIRTVGADGSPRAWALLPGGGIQPRDPAGDAFPMLRGAALAPAGPSGAP